MEQNNEIPARNVTHSDAGGKHKIVETFADDVATIIEGDNTGLVKKIIHGEEEKEIIEQRSSPESKKNRIFMMLGIILMLSALATLAYFFFQSNPAVVPAESQFTSIVFTDKNVFLEVAGLKKDAITQIILNEAHTTSVKDGGVEGIYLTENKTIVGLRKFISLIKSSFAPGGDASLLSDNFLMGIVKSNAGVGSTPTKDFFILLKARSTLDIFDSLRAWENKMLTDLSPLFEISINSDNKYLLTKNFEDGIIENKNARIIYDTENKPVMMYVFADNDSVIIASSPSAVKEIMLRLNASQLKK